MRKSLIILLFGAFFTCAFLPSTYALKTFQIEFHNLYLDKERKSDYAKKVVAAKCWLCHQGKSKKHRNPYGEELSKLLDKKKHKKES